jgi:hypothetical protein
VTQKKGAATSIKDYYYYYYFNPKFATFCGEEGSNSHIWTTDSSISPVHSQGFKKNLLFSLSCSQVWLNPLVEDRQSTYIMKLKKEKRKKKKRNHAYNVMSSDVFQFFLGFFLDQKFWKIFEELFFCCKFD